MLKVYSSEKKGKENKEINEGRLDSFQKKMCKKKLQWR